MLKCVGVLGGLRNRYSYIRIKNAPFVLSLIWARCWLQLSLPDQSEEAGGPPPPPPAALREITRGEFSYRPPLSFSFPLRAWPSSFPPLLGPPCPAMDRGSLLTVSLLCWSCGAVTAIRRADLFPFGTSSGDSLLAEGDDETSKVLILPKPFYFYNSQFSLLYVSIDFFYYYYYLEYF